MYLDTWIFLPVCNKVSVPIINLILSNYNNFILRKQKICNFERLSRMFPTNETKIRKSQRKCEYKSYILQKLSFSPHILKQTNKQTSKQKQQ